jgi:hypothetical protein
MLQRNSLFYVSVGLSITIIACYDNRAETSLLCMIIIPGYNAFHLFWSKRAQTSRCRVPFDYILVNNAGAKMTFLTQATVLCRSIT